MVQLLVLSIRILLHITRIPCIYLTQGYVYVPCYIKTNSRYTLCPKNIETQFIYLFIFEDTQAI